MMQTWKQFLVEREGSHSFASTQINLPFGISREIIEWGKSKIPDSDLLPDKGREDEIHVTVLYGLHANTDFKVRKVLEEIKPFDIELGKTSVFENEDFDVIKISVICPRLKEINQKIRDNCEHTCKYDYIPHVTIAYLKKGKGWQYNNDDYFVGTKFKADTILFCARDGKKTKIMLGTKK